MNIITFENTPPLPLEPHFKYIKAANYLMQHLINMMEDPIYVETGVSAGRSISFILQKCPSIKRAYGVDFWSENTDTFERSGDTHYSQAHSDRAFLSASNRILSSGHKDKVTLIKEDVAVAVDHFEDNSIDLLFLDHYLNKKDVEECLPMWYNKVKVGGYFAGHDWIYAGVKKSVLNFREQYDIKPLLSVSGGEWVWKKDGNI